MNNPFNPRRRARPIDKTVDYLNEALKDSDDVLDVEKTIERLLPQISSLNYRPSDERLKAFYRILATIEGRELLDWLLDLTWRAPYPHVGKSIAEAAIAAAKHEARAGIGEVILEALALGKYLIEKESNYG